MKLTFGKSDYEVTDGKFLARFEGITLREATGAKDQRGNVMPPGMTWDFTLLEGPDNGKRADRLTGRNPTPKAGAGRMLAGLADLVLKDGMEIEIDQFIGKCYRVTIIDGKVSDAPAPVRVYDQNLPAAGPRPPTPPSPARVLAPKDDSQWQWHDGNNNWLSGTAVDFRAWMGKTNKLANEVFAAPAGSQDSKLASDHGFEVIPF